MQKWFLSACLSWILILCLNVAQAGCRHSDLELRTFRDKQEAQHLDLDKKRFLEIKDSQGPGHCQRYKPETMSWILAETGSQRSGFKHNAEV